MLIESYETLYLNIDYLLDYTANEINALILESNDGSLQKNIDAIDESQIWKHSFKCQFMPDEYRPLLFYFHLEFNSLTVYPNPQYILIFDDESHDVIMSIKIKLNQYVYSFMVYEIPLYIGDNNDEVE
jgi:hypothetical protein